MIQRSSYWCLRFRNLHSIAPQPDAVKGLITDIHARSILDSRGRPTVEVECFVDGSFMSRAAVPSGASTGSHEAVELRDGGELWNGSGVERAVKNVNTVIREILVGSDVSDQEAID